MGALRSTKWSVWKLGQLETRHFFSCTRTSRPSAQLSRLLDCSQAPPWTEEQLSPIQSPHLSRKGIHVAVIHVVITVSDVQALHHAAFIEDLIPLFLVLFNSIHLCTAFKTFWISCRRCFTCKENRARKTLPFQFQCEPDSHMSTISLKNQTQ